MGKGKEAENDAPPSARFEALVEDYARCPVPDGKTVSGLRIALIVIGIAITVPAFLTGLTIGRDLGLKRAVLAFAGGGALIALIACATGAIGAASRLPTAMIVRHVFGRRGALVVNGLIALTMLGWYGVTAELFGQALHTMLADSTAAPVPEALLIVLGSALMIATTMFGFKALDTLSLVAVPLMLMFLAALVWLALGQGDGASWAAAPVEGLSLGQAISAVAGAFMVGAVVLPDLCRYARSVPQAIMAAVLSFLVGFPLVLLAASVPGLALGVQDFIAILVLLGLGVPGFVLMVFATWTTNANNLYSASLFLAPVFEQVAKWKIVIVAGLAGTLVALNGMIDLFIPFLVFLGVTIPPIAGLYGVDFLLHRNGFGAAAVTATRDVNGRAFGAWLLASGFGYGAAEGWVTFTTIPACDSLLLAGLLYAASRRGAALWRRFCAWL